jgi:hypothetical protein
MTIQPVQIHAQHSAGLPYSHALGYAQDFAYWPVGPLSTLRTVRNNMHTSNICLWRHQHRAAKHLLIHYLQATNLVVDNFVEYLAQLRRVPKVGAMKPVDSPSRSAYLKSVCSSCFYISSDLLGQLLALQPAVWCFPRWTKFDSHVRESLIFRHMLET